MLTITYSLIAMAAEQERARGLLSQLQQCLQAAWRGLQAVDLAFLETAFSKLVRLEEYRRIRKLELHLTPTLRAAVREAEHLIAELDLLSGRCRDIVRHVGKQLAALRAFGMRNVNEPVQAMDTYCTCLFARFEKEETQLLPLAQRLLSVEEWFALATNFLGEREAVFKDRITGSGKKQVRHISSTSEAR